MKAPAALFRALAGGTISIALFVASPASAQTPAPLPPGEDATVTEVIDGDTITVDIAGTQVTVRYIGMDAPESKAPAAPVECHAIQAAADNAAMVTGQTLRLERDRSDTDKFGRLLRYAWLPDGRLVNEALVASGSAFAKRYPPDTRRAAQLEAAMRQARAAKAGLWGLCQVAGLKTLPVLATPSPASAPAQASGIGGVRPLDEYTCPNTHTIKGNINRKKEHIYHRPGQRDYNKTKPETCFASNEGAEAAGFRAAKR